MRWLRYGLWALVLLAATSLFFRSYARPRSGVALAQYGEIPPFELLDQHRRPFRRETMVGKVWLADFIFTRCVETCPMLTSRMKQVERALQAKGPGLGEIQLVSFSVDPAVDTPERLAEFARKWQASEKDWMFVTGATEAVQKVVTEGFKLGMTPVPKGDFVDIVHSNRFVLIDRRGQIRGYYDAESPEDMRKIVEDAVGLQSQ